MTPQVGNIILNICLKRILLLFFIQIKDALWWLHIKISAEEKSSVLLNITLSSFKADLQYYNISSLLNVLLYNATYIYSDLWNDHS